MERWQRGGRVVTGGAGIDLSLLHALNVETMSLPAVALAARVLVPMGPFAADRAYPTLTAIATRTTSLGRVHANASFTAGSRPLTSEEDADGAAGELSRWEGGIAVDRPFPLRALLAGAELLARSPLRHGAEVEWSAASGLRYQVSPRLALDLGAGRDFAGDGECFVTFGSALSFGLLHRFDYGHAIPYETLCTHPGAPPARLEEREFDFLTRKLLVSPPRLPLEEMAIEPMYARLAPEAKAMFEWAHLLHRQLYDILADERIPDSARDADVQSVVRYYLSRRDLAFSVRPKSMALMQEQPYSLAFRQSYPKFNGLIWGYHWLQVGLYEPLLEGKTLAERQTGVAASVARFRQMIADAPRSTPYVMPMTPAVAPRFAARYPEAAIIFDNLHSMHDVISDILANPSVPRDCKRQEILLAASRYRDDTTEEMSVEGWRKVSAMMGVQNMGGVTSALVGALPTPTVARGAVMRHDRDGNMIGDEHAGHDMPMPESATTPAGDSAVAAETVHAFHRALAAGDSAQALSLLTNDVVIQEGGAVETRDAYRRGHLAGDVAFARAVPSERSPVAVTVSGDVAWARSSSTTVGEYRGRRIDSAGAELMVLVRQGGAWRIAAIHWSSRNRAPR